MKKCPTCEHKVENDDNVCPNCGWKLRVKCSTCGRMEPVRFINAKVCQEEARKTKEGFISKNSNSIPIVMIGISGVLMLLSLFLTKSVYMCGLILWFSGLIYFIHENRKLELLFIKKHPEIGVLLIDIE